MMQCDIANFIIFISQHIFFPPLYIDGPNFGTEISKTGLISAQQETPDHVKWLTTTSTQKNVQKFFLKILFSNRAIGYPGFEMLCGLCDHIFEGGDESDQNYKKYHSEISLTQNKMAEWLKAQPLV